jgi:hypothetical protein
MLDFIERLRAKPEHIRHRYAYGTAAGISGVVAVVWLFTLVASGSLILGAQPAAPVVAETVNGQTVVQASTAQIGGAVTQTKTAFSQLLGAAGAAFTGGTTTPAITVEDAATTTPVPATSGPTAGSGGNQSTIPF